MSLPPSSLCWAAPNSSARSMIASAVDTRNKGFFVLARRRNTELRLPAISRDGASPSNGKVFSLGNTSTLSEAASEWSTLPGRSALFSFSRGIRCRYDRTSSIVRGDGAPEEEEIVERGEPLLFFIAPAAARAFLVFPT